MGDPFMTDTREMTDAELRNIIEDILIRFGAAWNTTDANSDICALIQTREAALRERIEKLSEALRFYEDPWKYQIDVIGRSGPDDTKWESTPDFYDELSFGDRARAALEAKQ
jgi:hypothetical protein